MIPLTSTQCEDIGRHTPPHTVRAKIVTRTLYVSGGTVSTKTVADPEKVSRNEFLKF